MVETDWREILSFSQRELMQADKEKLCESLSWMEADDIELNFSDLKMLFRLAQDILKYKSEQVSNLMGQLDTTQRKGAKTKVKSSYTESSTRSIDNPLETISHQEDLIKANKEILEQLHADIAELEGRKNKLEENKNNLDQESESSRGTLSEMDAVMQLEDEITMKNRHIRKLLSDVKVLEEENTNLKEKVTVLKDKLTEATQLIDNLTEQLLALNNDCTQLKEILGRSEQTKSHLSVEIEALRKEISERESTQHNIVYAEIKSKVQHWKNIARSKKSEVEALSIENSKLKDNLAQILKSSSPKENTSKVAELKTKELQDKLLEASVEIDQSAYLINMLRAENKRLKTIIDEAPDYSVSDTKNESDDGKERTLINKLKRKVKSLTDSLQGAEEMISIREKELTEITSQLQLVRSDDGMSTLIEGLKNKKRQLKFKDESIKKFVQEINILNHQVNDLELENETLRQKLNIPPVEKISTMGTLKRYRDMEQNNLEMAKELRNMENKLVCLELNNRNMNTKISKMTKMFHKLGYNNDKIDDIDKTSEVSDNMPIDGGGESSVMIAMQAHKGTSKETKNINMEIEVQTIFEENEGLRKGLQEILDFLKDNSTTSSGVLALQCPSLEAVLRSMEARHTAGWFAPHMSTVMELRAALESKNALLTALHEARKETFCIMNQLSNETKKSSELEQKLSEMESKEKLNDEEKVSIAKDSVCEFGSWMSEIEQNSIDFFEKTQIDEVIAKGNSLHEGQLKKGLEYFHVKFKNLFDKITTMTVEAADNDNKWTIKEEQYNAQIENLKTQLHQQDDEDISDPSPGVIPILSNSFLVRKCSYLEESYKYIRTLNENLKNENLESKRAAMVAAADYESQVQRLILAIANLTDKLRSSISIDLFWKQNTALNEIILKYRMLVEKHANSENISMDALKNFKKNKIEIINHIENQLYQDANLSKSNTDRNNMTVDTEPAILQQQLQQVCSELQKKNNIIEQLEKTNMKLQEIQMKQIDKTLASQTKEQVDSLRDQLQILIDENKILKEQYQHVGHQLDIALLQLQDNQQSQMSNDIEINMLRHQILDLQSSGDGKAIIARLSGEVLVAHLQASDYHKKVERLASALNKEKEHRTEAEEMLKARQKIFDVYAFRYDSKFRYMYELIQSLREQYQGSLPLMSIENYLIKMEDLSRDTRAVNEQLNALEDLQSSLITKHSIFDQILDVSKGKCLTEEDACPHKLKYLVMQSSRSRELDQINKKLKSSEQSREELIKQCNNLEKTLVLVSQIFEKSALNDNVDKRESNGDQALEVEDVQSDDESNTRRNQTITLSEPKLLKQEQITKNDTGKMCKEDTTDMQSPAPLNKKIPELISVHTQTSSFEKEKIYKSSQTDEDIVANNELKVYIEKLKIENDKKNKKLNEVMSIAHKRTEEAIVLNTERITLESQIQHLKDSYNQKDKLNERLRATIVDLRKQMDDFKTEQITESSQFRDAVKEENRSILIALKQLDADKNSIAAEYNELFKSEREEYSKATKDFQVKIMELRSELDRRGSDSNATNAEALKEVITKNTMKITELEEKCFRLQNELDECKAELTTYQSEADRWKNLASERLVKMDQLNSQLEERHCHEVEAYKAENQHWMSKLNETQKEHMELRSRLTEQKAIHMKQLADKDVHIEQLRNVVHNLKAQVMNMQTMLSVNDPSFDLSAIVEVDEASDALSQHGSDRLELKYESTVDFNDLQDDMRMPSSTSTLWQDTIIERLRREKQLAGKQNAILRRQIKALAARERRARLDAQNLKNQVFRISTSGSKVTTAETAALHNKIASLQAQLTSARRDTQSNVALWDKWKRAQQASERWQARYEEKCQEVKKMEMSLNLAKSAMNRLDREKRVLLSRITEIKSEHQITIEKQEDEPLEKSHRSITDTDTSLRHDISNMPMISSQALVDRVQAQQYRIAALELAEKGNEYLVSEYEKSLAQVTSLKGQVIKLESTLLESQIRTPIKTNNDTQPEIDYWKSYCEMLKEENVQLTLKVNALEPTPSTPHHHRVNDLEQTVLTLRGLVSKLQAEQKSSVHKKADSRPSSGRSATEKGRNQLESYRIEIANLRRSIQDKDLLLERSKEMLKIAAEREEELLRENAFLRRRIDDLTNPKGGFLSA